MSISLFAKLYNRFGHKPSIQEDLEKISAKINRELPAIPDGAYRPLAGHAHVAVVGGGFAGLSAAYYLTQGGFHVTMLEARDKIGGRVQTSTDLIPGRFIEAGAELIGSNHLLWMTLAKRFGLSLMVVSQDEHFTGALLDMPIRFGGNDLDAEKQDWLYKELDKAYATLNADASEILFADRPWEVKGGFPAAQKFDDKSVKEWIDDWLATLTHDQDDKDLLRIALTHNLENDQTITVDLQSYLGLLAAVKGGTLMDDVELKDSKEPSEYWTHSEVFRCANGNEKLAHALLAACRAAEPCFELHCTTAVEAIIPKDDGVWIEYKSNGKRTRARFDAVVVAVPTPAYPSIAGIKPPWIAHGKAVKHLSRVKSRFWLQSGKAPTGIDDAIGSFWEGSDNQTDSGNADFDISLFSGCKAADNVFAQSQGSLTHMLERACPGYHAALQYSKFMDWPNEPWIQTGYSCPAVGQVTNAAMQLYKGEPRVVYAGEHTCMSHFGYMEGALQSGLRAARQLLANQIWTY